MTAIRKYFFLQFAPILTKTSKYYITRTKTPTNLKFYTLSPSTEYQKRIKGFQCYFFYHTFWNLYH